MTPRFSTTQNLNSDPKGESLDSDDIQVESYDFTLMLPMLISEQPVERSKSKLLDRWVKLIVEENPEWSEVSNYPRRDLQGKEAFSEYAEFLYFHPFVRNFLYLSQTDLRLQKKGNPRSRTLRTLKRKIVMPKEGDPRNKIDESKQLPAAKLDETVEETKDSQSKCDYIQIDYQWKSPGDTKNHTKSIELNVRQIQLNIFDTGVAVFSLKLEQRQDQQLTLTDVLQIQDIFRRLYPPFWNVLDDNSINAGFCPSEVKYFKGGNKIPVYSCDYQDKTSAKAQKEFVDENREPCLVSFWEWLLNPIQVAKYRPAEHPWFYRGKPFLEFRQVQDERTPFMSRIAVKDPRLIKQADWMRLVGVDGPGSSDQYPVSPAFPEDNFLSYCYDRFWSQSDEEPACRYTHSTRWLCSGYAFVGVGSTELKPGVAQATKPFIESHGRDHFRHHYFKLGLIAHFHRASLLSFERRLAEAVDSLRDGMHNQFKREEFEEAIQEIEVELSRFRSQFWFTEVSNHVQAQELFDMWSEHLGTRKLFDEVFNEARDASQIVIQWNEKAQAESSERLSLVALAFLVVAPLISMITSDISTVFRQIMIGLPVALGTILIVLVFGKRLSHIINCLGDGRWKRLCLVFFSSKYRKRTKAGNLLVFALRMLFIGLMIGLIGLLPSCLRNQPGWKKAPLVRPPAKLNGHKPKTNNQPNTQTNNMPQGGAEVETREVKKADLTKVLGPTLADQANPETKKAIQDETKSNDHE